MKKLPKSLPNSERPTPLINDGVFVRLPNKEYYHKLLFSEILYLNRSDSYIEIKTVDDKKYLIKNAISNLEEVLKNWGFIKVHRSYIINLWRVDELSKEFVVISNVRLAISPAHYDEIIAKIIVLDNDWN